MKPLNPDKLTAGELKYFISIWRKTPFLLSHNESSAIETLSSLLQVLRANRLSYKQVKKKKRNCTWTHHASSINSVLALINDQTKPDTPEIPARIPSNAAPDLHHKYTRGQWSTQWKGYTIGHSHCKSSVQFTPLASDNSTYLRLSC